MAGVYTKRRRWLVLAVGLPLYTFAMMVISSFVLLAILTEKWVEVDPLDVPAVTIRMLRDPQWWASFGPCAAILVGLQVVFLVPLFVSRPPRDRRGRSLTVSLLIAGMIAGVLTMGLATAVIELVALTTTATGSASYPDAVWMIAPTMLILGWVFWSAVLLVFCRGLWADRTLGRVVGLLLAGTLLEILVVIPLDLMVRRRTDCYCATGTFFTLGLASLAALWLAGPGIAIALLSKRHRLWREVHCARCGYPKGPSPGPRCPECGHAWAAEKGD